MKKFKIKICKWLINQSISLILVGSGPGWGPCPMSGPGYPYPIFGPPGCPYPYNLDIIGLNLSSNCFFWLSNSSKLAFGLLFNHYSVWFEASKTVALSSSVILSFNFSSWTVFLAW